MEKKAFCLLLAGVLMLAVVGCGQSKRSSESSLAATEGSEEIQPDADTGESDGETEDSSEAEQQSAEMSGQATNDLKLDGATVSTQFYQVTVPDSWRYNVNYHYYQNPEEGIYTLEIFEISSVKASQGQKGLVFSITLHRSYPEEPDTLPDDYLGLLKNEEGTYYYVAFDYPGSSQYEDSSEAAYEAVRSGAEQVKGTIEGLNGYTFEALSH